jgi:hypothetical protein
MDEAGVWKVISFDGRSVDNFYIEHIRAYQIISPERFGVCFTPNDKYTEHYNELGERPYWGFSGFYKR